MARDLTRSIYTRLQSKLTPVYVNTILTKIIVLNDAHSSVRAERAFLILI